MVPAGGAAGGVAAPRAATVWGVGPTWPTGHLTAKVEARSPPSLVAVRYQPGWAVADLCADVDHVERVQRDGEP